MTGPSGQLGNEPNDLERVSTEARGCILVADFPTPQSNIKNDLETLFAHLQSLRRRFREGRVTRNRRIFRKFYSYNDAKFNAEYYRSLAHVKDPTTIDLDSATGLDILPIEAMMRHKSEASEACYKAIDLIRSEVVALEEIIQTCSRILELVDEDSIRASMVSGIAIRARGEQNWNAATLQGLR